MQKITQIQKLANQFGKNCCTRFLNGQRVDTTKCGYAGNNRMQYMAQPTPSVQPMQSMQQMRLMPPAQLMQPSPQQQLIPVNAYNLTASAIQRCAANSYPKPFWQSAKNQSIFVPDIATQWYKSHRNETKSTFLAKYCQLLSLNACQPFKGGCMQKNRPHIIAHDATRFKRISQDFHKLLMDHEHKAAVKQKPEPPMEPLMKNKSQNTPRAKRGLKIPTFLNKLSNSMQPKEAALDKSRLSNERTKKRYHSNNSLGVNAHGYKYENVLRKLNKPDKMNVNYLFTPQRNYHSKQSKPQYDENLDRIEKVLSTKDSNSKQNIPMPTNSILKTSHKSRSRNRGNTNLDFIEPRNNTTVAAHGYNSQPKEVKRQRGGSHTALNKNHGSRSASICSQAREGKSRSMVAAHGFYNLEKKEKKYPLEMRGTRKKSSKYSKQGSGHIGPVAHGYGYSSMSSSNESLNDNRKSKPTSCRKESLSRNVSAHGYRNPSTDCKSAAANNSKNKKSNKTEYNEEPISCCKRITRKKNMEAEMYKKANDKSDIGETTSGDSVQVANVNKRRRKKQRGSKNLEEIWIKPNATEMRSTDSGVSMKRNHAQQHNESRIGEDKRTNKVTYADNKKTTEKQENEKTKKTYDSSSDTSSSNMLFRNAPSLKKPTRRAKSSNAPQKYDYTEDLAAQSTSKKPKEDVKMAPTSKNNYENYMATERYQKYYKQSTCDLLKGDDDKSNKIRHRKNYEKNLGEKKAMDSNHICSKLNPNQYYHCLSHHGINKVQVENVLSSKKSRTTYSSDSSDSCESDDEVDKQYYHKLSHKKERDSDCESLNMGRRSRSKKDDQETHISQYYHTLSHCNNDKRDSCKLNRSKREKSYKRAKSSADDSSDEERDKHYYHTLSHKKASGLHKKGNAKKAKNVTTSSNSDHNKSQREQFSSDSDSSFDLPRNWNMGSRRRTERKVSDSSVTDATDREKENLRSSECVSNSYSNLLKNKQQTRKCYDHTRFWKNKNKEKIIKSHGYNDEVNAVPLTIRNKKVDEPEYILGRDDTYRAQKYRKKY